MQQLYLPINIIIINSKKSSGSRRILFYIFYSKNVLFFSLTIVWNLSKTIFSVSLKTNSSSVPLNNLNLKLNGTTLPSYKNKSKSTISNNGSSISSYSKDV